jgi:hypothetical protein
LVAPHPDVTQHTDGSWWYEDHPRAAYPAGFSPWVYTTLDIFSPNWSFRCIAKPPVTEKHVVIPFSSKNVATYSAIFILICLVVYNVFIFAYYVLYSVDIHLHAIFEFESFFYFLFFLVVLFVPL